MTRRPWVVLGGLLAASVAATSVLVLTRDRDRTPVVPPNADRADGLTLLVVNTRGGPFGAVVGSTGSEDGALVLPTEVQVTIPGQGDGVLSEALELPARQAATTVANVLGVWVDHHVVFTRTRLTSLVDRAGGIDVGGTEMDGEATLELLEEAGDGRAAAFQLVMDGLLSAGLDWSPSDLPEADSPSSVLNTLEAAGGAPVVALPAFEAADGIYQARPEDVRRALVEAFGGPNRQVIGAIVLNGSGVPGVGELVAERIVPDGFRVVVSENASDFDHDETLVVVGSADDVALGERVRDLLGVGSVNVSVSSGIAPVTIVVGKDFPG